MTMLSRRRLLAAGGGLLGGALLAGRRLRAADADVVEIRMRSDPEGSHVGFDPNGLLIAPGQTVRWICQESVHTTTAYHPANAKHSLRIPESAKPWDSGFLLPDQDFSVIFTVEGVYDYYCMPHEMAGMVGRIIVGHPAGPGTQPFDYFAGRPEAKDWMKVPPAAQKAFPSVARIMQQHSVPGLKI